MWLKFIDNRSGRERLVNLDAVSNISIERHVDSSRDEVFLNVYLSDRELSKDEAGGYDSFCIDCSNVWDELLEIMNYICACLESNVIVCDLQKTPPKEELDD